MQTLQRKEPRPRSKPRRKRGHGLASGSETIVVTLLTLAAFLVFVQTMAGFDVDTIFLAVYCTVVAVFVIQSFLMAFSRRA